MPEAVTDDDAQYALDIVKAICTEVGPGLPGSPQERERAAMIKRELESHLGTGNVAVEEFTFAPAASLRSSFIIGLLILLAAFLNLSVGLLTLLAASLIQLAGLIADSASLVRFGTRGWPLLVYPIVPSVVFALLKTRGWKNGGNVPGAADNLSACALAVAMCRFLVKNPACIPDDTEIRVISFGSEEAGCRGSRRYVARHLDELRRLDVRQLNFETIAHPEIVILTSETNGTVRVSPDMVSSATAAAQRAGVPFKVRAASIGMGSDAGPLSKAGLKATTLVGFTTKQQVAFYHQKWDTPEVLSLEPLLNVLKLTLEWVRHGGVYCLEASRGGGPHRVARDPAPDGDVRPRRDRRGSGGLLYAPADGADRERRWAV
jgi:hypothetical protein